MERIIYKILPLSLFVVFVFYFRADIQNTFYQLRGQYFPCNAPIAYSVGDFDDKFGLSKQEFLLAIKEAEAIWEEPSGKDLFKYDTTGNLKINLIYDNRQEATLKLKDLDAVLDTSKASYNTLKTKFDSLNIEYQNDKKIFNQEAANLEIRKTAFEQDVEYWNKKGGAPKDVYSTLQQEQLSLNKEINRVNQIQKKLVEKVAEVNALAGELNSMVKSLNLNVNKFNEIGESNGEEFEEGVYIRDMQGARIEIYQFDNNDKLVRVLAHELGHALGLEHIEDPKAIMYRLNSGKNKKLSENDILELNKKCNQKIFD